jgi:Rieske Fe-S protein
MPDANPEGEPESETDRRRFVKGVVGSAALAGAGTASAGLVNVATVPPGEGGGATEFVGIENVAGPAPRGMPVIPVEVDEEGYLRGVWPDVKEVEGPEGRTNTVAETELGGVTYSSRWFQYCGVQTLPGVAPDVDQDEFFRYADTPLYDWQREDVEAGAKMHVEDFADYETWGNGIGEAGLGKPAVGTWRSQGVDDEEQIPVQVLRVPPDVFGRMREETDRTEWLDAASSEGFVAWLDKCTHFCCVPSFKGVPGSATAADNGANLVYCACHQSTYDPFSLVSESFVALPRPEE